MRSGYESDITRFLRELKKKNPNIERVQREGRDGHRLCATSR